MFNPNYNSNPQLNNMYGRNNSTPPSNNWLNILNKPRVLIVNGYFNNLYKSIGVVNCIPANTDSTYQKKNILQQEIDHLLLPDNDFVDFCVYFLYGLLQAAEIDAAGELVFGIGHLFSVLRKLLAKAL